MVAAAVIVVAGLPGVSGLEDPASSEQAPELLEGTDRLTPYRGDLHAHTSYSDGEDAPERAFADARDQAWLDFFAVTDHSEWFTFPFKADDDCIGPQAVECYSSPVPRRTEWGDTGHQAQRFTGEDFLAMRGFEWSSFVEGHVNVYETRVWTDSVQTGQAPMTGFYAWMESQQLDDDRFATFNHPGREELKFDDFAYVPQMDRYFVSLESFNRDDDYSDEYLQALDAGWHLGTHGVTDGHGTEDRIRETDGHTVALMSDLTKPALRRSLVQHHTVAIQGNDQDARFYVDGYLMGDTVPQPGSTVTVQAELLDAGHSGPTSFERVELLGPEGWQRSLAIGEGEDCQRGDEGADHVECQAEVSLEGMGTTDLDERYLVLRAYQHYEGEVRPTVVTSAVWLN